MEYSQHKCYVKKKKKLTMLSFEVQSKCSEYQVKNYIKDIKEYEWKERGKILLKVYLVLINIKFKLDFSILVMVTNSGIEFGSW